MQPSNSDSLLTREHQKEQQTTAFDDIEDEVEDFPETT